MDSRTNGSQGWRGVEESPKDFEKGVEGDYDHIVNRGSLCVKGISMFATHSSPNRLQTPRYRAPGSDHWEEISWEDAVERVAQKIRKTRDAKPRRRNGSASLRSREKGTCGSTTASLAELTSRLTTEREVKPFCWRTGLHCMST